MELVLWLLLCTYHGATKAVTDCWNVVRGLPVTVYELVLWLLALICNRLLECGLWFSGNCVYELGFFHNT